MTRHHCSLMLLLFFSLPRLLSLPQLLAPAILSPATTTFRCYLCSRWSSWVQSFDATSQVQRGPNHRSRAQECTQQPWPTSSALALARRPGEDWSPHLGQHARAGAEGPGEEKHQGQLHADPPQAAACKEADPSPSLPHGGRPNPGCPRGAPKAQGAPDGDWCEAGYSSDLEIHSPSAAKKLKADNGQLVNSNVVRAVLSPSCSCTNANILFRRWTSSGTWRVSCPPSRVLSP
jgi:hypothetical protein